MKRDPICSNCNHESDREGLHYCEKCSEPLCGECICERCENEQAEIDNELTQKP